MTDHPFSATRRTVLTAGLTAAGAIALGQPARATSRKVLYETDFIHGFTVNDSGRGRDGKPCWMSRFPYGRVVNNEELGLYADPVLHPQTDPFPVIDGRRCLQSQRLQAPIMGLNKQWQQQAYLYSAALMSAPHLVVTQGQRIEVRLAMPHALQKGHWAGFWMLDSRRTAAGGWPWPPELDIVEHWTHNEGDRLDAFWNTLHSGTTEKVETDARSISLSALGLKEDVRDMLTYAAEFNGRSIDCYVNDHLVAQRTTPDPGIRWYPILDMAVAGDGGPGKWPGAPGEDTPFPQRIVLESLRILGPA
jgi:hypothetical protein